MNIIFSKYSSKGSSSNSSISSSTGGFSSSNGYDFEQTTTTGGINRILWGNSDDGEDLNESMWVNGNIHIGEWNIEYEEDEDGDLDEELPILPKEEEDAGTGNIYATGKIEGDSTYGKTVYLDYNNVKTNILDLLLPVGSIIMFNGSTSVPNNWQICNGSNGTPDLRGKFIKGVGTVGEIGTTGGATTHSITVSEMPSHTHTYWDGAINTGSAGAHTHTVTSSGVSITQGEGTAATPIGSVGGSTGSAGEHTHSISYTSSNTGSAGSGTAFNIEPPYYTLIYIMKVS